MTMHKALTRPERVRNSVVAISLAAVFGASGCASLIYQVVWQRMIGWSIGSSSVSVAIVVAGFLAGLGVGGFFGGKAANRVSRHWLWFVVVEGLVAIYALASAHCFDSLVGSIAAWSYAWRCAFLVLAIFLPGILMGAGLPLLVEVFVSIGIVGKNAISNLYGINTIGAALGALLSPFFFIPYFGIDGAIYVGVGINSGMVLAILVAARWLKPRSENEDGQQMTLDTAVGVDGGGTNISKQVILVVVFLTGFINVGLEVLWFRILGLFLKPSAYFFGNVLFWYLLGLGVGGFLVVWVTRWRKSSSMSSVFLLNGIVSVVAGLGILWVFMAGDGVLLKSVFNQRVHPPSSIASVSASSALSFIWLPAILVFLPTIPIGASFVMLASVFGEDEGHGRWLGKTVMVTVVGNFLGSLGVTFLLFPTIGVVGTSVVLVGAGCIWWMVLVRQAEIRKWCLAGLFVTICTSLGILLMLNFGDRLHRGALPLTSGAVSKFVESSDSIVWSTSTSSAIAVPGNTYLNGSDGDSVFGLYLNGELQGRCFLPVTESMDGRVVEAAGMCGNLDSVLVIGYGAGGFLGSLTQIRDQPDITLVELFGAVVDNALMWPSHRELLTEKGVEVIVGDARTFLNDTDSLYDLVMIDAVQMKTAGSSNVYSKEFFELVKSRLREDGVFYCMNANDIFVPNTVASVFSEVFKSKRMVVGVKGHSPSAIRRNELQFLRFGLEVPPTLNEYQFSKEDPIITDFRPRGEFYLTP